MSTIVTRPRGAVCHGESDTLRHRRAEHRARGRSPGSSRTSSSTGRSTTRTPTPSPNRSPTKIGVGKRVEAPFGTRRRRRPPASASASPTRRRPRSFEIKPIARVLDDDALVDDHLMKLTRWMADYYLCGWGQVLHAVVPAGVRENAGTRRRGVRRAGAEGRSCRTRCRPSRRNRRPRSTSSRRKNRPLEILQLARLAKCTHRRRARARQEGAGAEVQRAHRNRRPASPEREARSEDDTTPLAPTSS